MGVRMARMLAMSGEGMRVPIRSTASPDPNAASVAFSDPEALMSHAEVCRLCGGVSTMTIWRWRQDGALKFPAPTVINERCYCPAGRSLIG